MPSFAKVSFIETAAVLMGSPPGKGVSAYRFIHRFNLEARHIGIEQNVPMDHKIECWRFANILEANGDSYGFSDSWQPGGLMGLKIHNSNARHGHVWPLVELKLPLRGSQCLISGITLLTCIVHLKSGKMV
jgi:hypothetical protein